MWRGLCGSPSFWCRRLLRQTCNIVVAITVRFELIAAGWAATAKVVSKLELAAETAVEFIKEAVIDYDFVPQESHLLISVLLAVFQITRHSRRRFPIVCFSATSPIVYNFFFRSDFTAFNRSHAVPHAHYC